MDSGLDSGKKKSKKRHNNYLIVDLNGDAWQAEEVTEYMMDSLGVSIAGIFLFDGANFIQIDEVGARYPVDDFTEDEHRGSWSTDEEDEG